MNIVKRFVAGAICPRCSQSDTIRIYRNEIREYRECVKCDYKDGQNLDGSPELATELKTRVNQEKVVTSNVPKIIPIIAEPINFDPNPNRNKKV